MLIRIIKLPSSCLLPLLILVTMVLYPAIHVTAEHVSPVALLAALDLSAVQRHVRVLASESRFLGYPGYYAAVDYVKAELARLGINVATFEFEAAVPYYEEAYLELPGGARVEVYPLAPNVIALGACPAGVEGPLVYAGRGDLEELEGLPIEGAIVVMDFDCGDDWVYALRLGASAILFLEPSRYSRLECEPKILSVPVDIPRAIIPREAARLIKEAAERHVVAKLVIRAQWRRAKAYNIVALIPGTKYPDEYIVLVSHLDAFAISPRLAFGAEEALGPAFMLELARLLVENRPKRSVLMIFTSGRWMGHIGLRYLLPWLKGVLIDEQAGRSRAKLALSFEFSSDALLCNLSLVYTGHSFYMYGARSYYESLLSPRDGLITTKYLPRLLKALGEGVGVFPAISPDWQVYFPEPIIFDAEPLSLLGIRTLCLYPALVRRQLMGTPGDTPSSIRWDVVAPQMRLAAGLVWLLASDDDIAGDALSDLLPSSKLFCELTGYVVEYDALSGWYTKVLRNDTLVVIEADAPNQRIILFADSNGTFHVPAMASMFWVSEAIGSEFDPVTYRAYAFRYEPEVGITLAPDFGRYGARCVFQLMRAKEETRVIVFEDSGSVVLPGILDPVLLKPPEAVSIDVLDARTGEDLEHYSYFYDSDRGILVLFAKRGSTFLLGYFDPESHDVLGFITNATADSPRGRGIRVPPRQLILSNAALRVAEDMFCLVRARYLTLKRHYVDVPTIHSTLMKAENLLDEAHAELRERRYLDAYGRVYAALSLMHECYHEVKDLMLNVSNVTVLFSLLLIPFVLIMLKLFGLRLDRRGAAFVLLMLAFLTFIFYQLHPGYHIGANVLVVTLSLTIILLNIPIIARIYELLSSAIREIRIRTFGYHEAEISRASMASTALTLGVEYMRRRSLRTLLTLLTVAIVTFGVISLSAAAPPLILRAEVKHAELPYPGFVIRMPEYRPVPWAVYDMLRGLKVGDVFPRAGLFLTIDEEEMFAGRFPLLTSRGHFVSAPGGAPAIKAILAISPEDRVARELGLSELAGAVVYLPSWTKSMVHVNDTLWLRGVPVRVAGFFDESKLSSMVEADGEPSTPVHMCAATERITAGFLVTVFVETFNASEVAIIPVELAKLIEPESLNKVVVVMESANATEVLSRMQSLAAVLRLEDFIGGADGLQYSLSYSKIKRLSLSISKMLTVTPLAIAALLLINVMLATVYERQREINIFNAVGLSPLHVSLLFFAESLVYGVVGGVIGYILGLLLNFAIRRWPVIPIPGLNYSSGGIILALGVAMLTVVLSALYPALKASRLSVPSLERKWRPPTKPKGDRWLIPFPFAGTRLECFATLVFLREFFESRKGAQTGAFATISVTLGTKALEDRVVPCLRAEVQLAPFEAGIHQTVEIYPVPSGPARYSFMVNLKRTRGELPRWVSSNRMFLTELRKQFILWKTLPPSVRESYLVKARELARRGA